MKTLLEDIEKKEYFLEDNGSRKPISTAEAERLIKENCGTRSDYSVVDGFTRLELMTMEEWQAQNPS